MLHDDPWYDENYKTEIIDEGPSLESILGVRHPELVVVEPSTAVAAVEVEDLTPPVSLVTKKPDIGFDAEAVREYLDWIHPHRDTSIVIACKPPAGTTYGKGGKPCGYTGGTWGDIGDAADMAEWYAQHGARTIWATVNRATTTAWGNKWTIRQTARWQFLALDFDAELPFGAGTVCSTSEELAAVGSHVEAVKIDLAERGLPDPLHIETGNGHLLLIPITLWTIDDLLDPEARKATDNIVLMQRLAQCMAVAYDRPLVCRLDTGVLADPSRILGVVGTVNANKNEQPEQGRVARLRRVIGQYPDREPMTEAEFIDWAEGYIAEAEQLHGDKLAERQERQADAAAPRPSTPAPTGRVAAYINAVPPAVEGQSGDKATFKLAGKLYHGFGLSEEQTFEAMAEWNSRCSPPWTDDDLRAKIRSAAKNGTPPAPFVDIPAAGGSSTIEWTEVAVREEAERVQQAATVPVPAMPQGEEPVVLEKFEDVVSTPIDWIWPGRLARGKLTLICGDPGKGKSFLSMDIAARLSTGTPFPDGHASRIGTTLLITDEDDSGDTIKPRYLAMGGDPTKLRRIKTMLLKDKEGNLQEVGFCLQLVKMLTSAIRQCPDLQLIVIDPLMSYFGNAKSSDPAQVNALLGPLNEFAAQHKVAVMALVHLNKDSKNSNALYRSMGSISVVGKARLAFIVAPDKTDPTKRVLAQTKANASAECPSLMYELEGTTVNEGKGETATARVVWLGQTDVTADQLLAPAVEGTKVEDAETFLREYLTVNRKSDDVTKAGMEKGFKFDTLKRAKDKIGAKAKKVGLNGPWIIKALTPPIEEKDEGSQTW